MKVRVNVLCRYNSYGQLPLLVFLPVIRLCDFIHTLFIQGTVGVGVHAVASRQRDEHAVLCNSRITAEPLYNTPLFIGPYAAANNTALLA